MVRVSPSPLGKLLARHAEASVAEALADTRVVLVTGARQSGKSTLVGVVAKGRDAEWRNLDTAATRQAAIGGAGPDEPAPPRALLRLLRCRPRRA